MWKVKPLLASPMETRYRPVLENLVPPDPMSQFHLKRGSPDEEFPDLCRNSTWMGKILTRAMYRRQFHRCTPSGVIFDDVIRPGLEEPGDWSTPVTVGCVAGDAQSYVLFCDFFDRVIEAHHGHKITSQTPEGDFNYDNVKGGDDLDRSYAACCEVSVVRGVEDFCFPTHCSRGERRQLLTLASRALQRLEEEQLPGRLLLLEELNQEQQRELNLNTPSSSQLRIGVARDWPDARAVWVSEDGSLVVWVNMEDHLRLVSTRDDANITEAFKCICTNLQKPRAGPGPQLNRTITELKVKFTELERELVQLRELISQQPCQPTTAQPDPCTISTELGMLRQDRDSCRRELSLLRTEIRELHQDREQRLAALTALTEEVKELRGEREEHRRELTSLSKEVKELRGEREEHSRALTTLSEQPQERGGATQDLDEKLDHNQDPVSSQDPPIQEPTSTPSSTSSPQTSTSPHSTRPAQQREKTDIVLLIDSNGKFLNQKKLFPTHKVAKIWCPNTHHAIDLLSEERLGSPSHIIIHTGTNDLEPAGEVSESLKRVTEKASTTFPNSRVVISTLLPRKDFHPDTIHRINSSLSRDCAQRPNVHLAHHPTLDISCLYDHVHLFKSTVPIFAQTLKSVALNRDQSTAHRKSTSAHNPHRTPRHPQPTSRPTQWRQEHPQPHPHHVQIRPHKGNHDPPQARPQSLLSLGAPPQPQRQEPHPGPLSYAQVVRRAAEPTLTTPPHNELRDIQQMLSLLCSHLIGQDGLRQAVQDIYNIFDHVADLSSLKSASTTDQKTRPMTSGLTQNADN
ncbi:uncharacterized protein LOC125883192 [Epinephelus fuscoguttatus]|uniref:uncharacterized protein LOC125883192 n=1 Tax=Epinephelus fuscoguttatus TaxID=293821 RepID=UPI0020D00D20|nr:uncharacterized protein LOC125883192 [Epinephelus fuscoguttatus]